MLSAARASDPALRVPPALRSLSEPFEAGTKTGTPLLSLVGSSLRCDPVPADDRLSGSSAADRGWNEPTITSLQGTRPTA